nr:Fis family transcriptional regulator [Spirochaetota bacterium]
LRGKNIEGVSDSVINILMHHEYPGNIRELENIIEHAFVLCREAYIQPVHLPAHLKKSGLPLHDNFTLEEMERIYILKALEKNMWNRKNTAKDLGIDTTTLWRKIKNLNIVKE